MSVLKLDLDPKFVEVRCAGEILVDDIGRPSVTRELAASLFAEVAAQKAQQAARDEQFRAEMAARADIARQAFKQGQRHREEVAARGVTGFEALHEVVERPKGGAE
ncbi:hypothetical protein A5670_02135 [Mycolicibacterium fortuitum]|nr:hypothetical protein A5670_02135 [Mycolicibacterium fortuitum]